MRRRRFIGPRRRFVRRHIRRHRRRFARRTFRRLIFGSTIVFALVGTSMAFKMHRHDADRIQTETGKAPEDMTEEELTSAMKKLGIKSLELTRDEKLRVERADIETKESTGNCPRCGAALAGDENFCGSCGKSV